MKPLSSSFRDTSGFLFEDHGRLLRQVNQVYKSDYEMFKQSGLYDKLVQKGLLTGHKEADHAGMTADAYKVIEPEVIPFISYPYEWSFGQLKDAALATLEIQKLALKHGMTLKDASAFNIQFHRGKPVFIDTLSFEKYKEGAPWVAYGQFCRHFLAPLALMSYKDVRLNQLMKLFADGIPLDVASGLLPARSRLSFSLLIHIHLHANTQKKYANKPTAAKKATISKQRLESLILGLRIAVERLRIKAQETEWENYYDFTNYSDTAFSHKKEILTSFIERIDPAVVWDIGANTGEFTRLAAERSAQCIAFDIDPRAVDTAYRNIKKNSITNMLPLVMDITNPTPAIGWNNKERMSLKQRPIPDTVFALALVHHLAISNNLPLPKIARFFSEICKNLVVEFVPKTDTQVQKLLASRKDIFTDYTEETFKEAFKQFFDIREVVNIKDSERSIYLMQKHRN